MFIYFNRQFFEKLIGNLKQINYCIIGDHDNLPHSVNHDVDFWTNDLRKFRDAINESSKQTGFKILMFNQTSNGFNVAIYKKVELQICMMKIDVMSDCSFKSLIPLASSELFYSQRILQNNLYVATPQIESLVHLLYPLLEWGKIKPKYREEIRTFYRVPFYSDALSDLFGKSNALLIISCIDNEDWQKLENLGRSLKKVIFFRFLSNPSSLFRIINFFFHNFKRIFKPSGYSISFSGLDGAGKTTIVNLLTELFTQTFKCKKVYSGYWRPYVLPEIKGLFRNTNTPNPASVLVEAVDRKPKSFLISFCKLCYYCLDYFFGYFKLFGVRNRGGVVLFDRYYLDMIVHPQRFEMKLPCSIIRFFNRFLPKTDLSFFFWATPETIHSRKIEFSKEEILEQTHLYMKEGKFINGFTPLETNKPIIDEIYEVLLSMTKSRVL